MKLKYTTFSGQVIEYDDPEPKLERFLVRAQAMLNDRKASESDLTALIYSKENPLIDPAAFAARAVVTPDVFAKPEYHVLADFIVRKRAQIDGTDPAKVAAKYTLSVAEAAKRKGVTEDGIRRAIRERRLPAWFKDGVPFIEPKTLDAVQLGKRGPIVSPELEFQVGYDADAKASFRLFVLPGGNQPEANADEPVNQGQKIWRGKVAKWRRAAVLTGGFGKQRFFEIVPSSEDDPEAVEFHGFYVRGKFSIIRKINNPQDARQAWAVFQAS